MTADDRPAPTPEVEAGERETCRDCGRSTSGPHADVCPAPSQSPQGSELGDGAVGATLARVLTKALKGKRWVEVTPLDFARAVLAAGYLSPEQVREREAAAWDAGVDAAFRGAVTRQNGSDVKRSNPFRANRGDAT